jgi:hypothetical protein
VFAGRDSGPVQDFGQKWDPLRPRLRPRKCRAEPSSRDKRSHNQTLSRPGLGIKQARSGMYPKRQFLACSPCLPQRSLPLDLSQSGKDPRSPDGKWRLNTLAARDAVGWNVWIDPDCGNSGTQRHNQAFASRLPHSIVHSPTDTSPRLSRHNEHISAWSPQGERFGKSIRTLPDYLFQSRTNPPGHWSVTRRAARRSHRDPTAVGKSRPAATDLLQASPRPAEGRGPRYGAPITVRPEQIGRPGDRLL